MTGRYYTLVRGWRARRLTNENEWPGTAGRATRIPIRTFEK